MEGSLWEASSYLVAVFGSIVLWISYALFGLITRRYKQVFGRATYSVLIIAAPSGLLVYTLFLILKATPVLENPAVAGGAQWIAYLALVASGLFCLIGVGKFAGVLRQVTRPAVGEALFPVAGKGKS
ncbi:MAG: hypothetical protein HGA76_09320 [Candidatus Firestonebacteria bacterium]|nr:hypothetical protein [Candidatus Firestonebacteria bacterium]